MAKTIKLREGWLVQITWDDAHDCRDSSRPWQDKTDVTSDKADYRCKSAGYFLKEADGFVYIAGDTMNDFVSRVFAIPRGCIRNVQVLCNT